MEKIIIIAADKGHFKAYRITKEDQESPRVMLIKSYDSLDGHGKLADKLSDTAGRFGRGKGKNKAVMDSGERYNIELEMEKRLVKMIAEDIGALLKKEKCERWYLAAGEQINRQIVEQITREVKEKLAKNITANLTKIKKSEILNYFM